ncbi:MAG: hypothetical protein QGG36_20815, partial [Pirellulaceae bacterium]|nr:hypothetical protein [Pirellulaceae bacterium]
MRGEKTHRRQEMGRGGFKTLYDGLPRPSILEILGKRRPWKAPWKAIVRQDIGFEMRSKQVVQKCHVLLH